MQATGRNSQVGPGPAALARNRAPKTVLFLPVAALEIGTDPARARVTCTEVAPRESVHAATTI